MDFTPQPKTKNIFLYAYCLLQGIPYLLLVGIPLPICNGLQVVALVVYPFSRHFYRYLNYHISNFWLSLFVLWSRHIHGLKIIRSGDTIPKGKSAVLIGNHQEMPDIPIIFDLAYSHNTLGGVKFFVKRALIFAPFIGLAMRLLNFPFVKRSWAEDAGFIRGIFAKLKEYRTPVWVITFPEGTRIRPHKLVRSQEFARAKGGRLPHLENVLLPRSRGFVVTIQELRHRLDGVYDFTIGYSAGIPTLLQLVCGTVKEVHLNIRRYPITSLPESKEELSQWLTDRFVEKDKRMAYFFQHRHFPE